MDNTNTANKNRIAKNTLLLYIRMGITMFVALYTSRIVLNTLGIEDYGINNVVGGIVTMATLVTGSLASASQRFITFELGKNDFFRLKKVFGTSLFIHFSIAIIITVICETIGLWFLNNSLHIPAQRINAANWVLQCSVLSFAVNIISVPYNSLIISHEKMNVYAYISIAEVLLKLVIVFLLVVIPYDKLKVYAVLWLLVAVIIQLIYTSYCRKNFDESRVSIYYDRSVLKEMSGFAGYNFIEIAANMINKQGANFMLNIFFGPVLNAARGLSMQINGILDGFVTSFTTAMNPQITKSYASGNKAYMLELMEKGSKYSFFLFLLLSVPVMTLTEDILRIWLKLIPDYAVIFVRLVFIDSLIELMTRTFYVVISATGKIKRYQFVIGIFKLFNLPLCFILIKYFEFPPETIYFISILFTVVIMFMKLYLIKNLIEYSAKAYLKNVIVRCFIVAVVSLIFPMYILKYRQFDIWSTLGICVGLFLYGLFVVYMLGLDGKEKQILNKNLIKRIGYKYEAKSC